MSGLVTYLGLSVEFSSSEEVLRIDI